MLPYFNAKENKKVQLLNFGGLDTRAKAEPNTLSQCLNMSSACYPALSPRLPRKKIFSSTGITAIVTPEYNDEKITTFTGIKDNKFFYKGTEIDGVLSVGSKSIADFNGKICIFPDKMYYDYLPNPDTGQVSTKLESMEKSLSVSGVKFYSSYDSISGDYTAYISKSNGGFDCFCEGDSIIIEGCSKSANNTCKIQGKKDFASNTSIVSAIVKTVSADKLELLLYNKTGEKALFENTTESGSITIKVSIPDMDYICVHNNRLWGTAKNGEFIYASKLGDCMNFNSFQGLADDSWYSMIGTPGNFTGICSYRTSIVAFKRHCIHHIYGDSPQNFSIPKQTETGCIDGRSIAELEGVLYFLSSNGYMAYAGGEPYCISYQLTAKFGSAVSVSDGRHYISAAYDKNGSASVLVYDPKYNLWHQYDYTPFIGFINYFGSVYGATATDIYELDSEGEIIEWSFTTQRLTYNTMDYKGLNCIWIRLDAQPNTVIKIFVSRDDNEFELCSVLSPQEKLSSARIPVRFGYCDNFKLKISGTGNAIISDIEFTTHIDGRKFR